MSNVYNFDDKILHIESLQLKRTDEILNSRDEAVEALLNYCGDDTMDGMPLLARYWADSGQTEIKHVRGYIHNIDGHMGISVDDIVDVEDIYDYIDSAITANTKECKVSYWESNYMHTNNIPLTEAYNTRHGGYRMAKKELLYSLNLSDEMADKPGGDSVRGDENPVLYVTNVEDDRRKGMKNWFGNQSSHLNYRRWYEAPEVGSVNYSLLTVFSKAVRSHKHEFPANADYYKGVILDTRKYERKIHQALYQSEKAQGKNDNFVVKKVFPLNPNQAYRYYYPGGIVKFMVPAVAPGVSVEIRFPKHYDLLGGDLNESFYNQLMRNSGRGYWRSDNVSVNFFTNESGYNYLLIVNSGDEYTTKASITLKNEIMDNLVLTPINSTPTYRVLAFDSVNSQGRPSDIGRVFYLNCLNGVDASHKGFVFDYTIKFSEKQIYGLAAKSPAMGFVIEQGKIKCYRKSNINDCFGWNFASQNYVKHIKDGTSFYYNERNVSNCGISFSIVDRHRDCLNSLADMKKTEGRVEYLGAVRRRKIYVAPGDTYIDNACKFWARPDHVVSDGTYSFIVGKTESNYKVSVGKIGVSFVGTDGETKEGYFKTYGNEPLPPMANEYVYEAREFYMKMKNGEYQYFGTLSSDFTNSMKVTYMEFDIGNMDEKALRFIGCCSTDSPRYFRNSRTKWKIINHSNMLARNFTRSNFNRCRYFRKYRGVPSEFPEYFYTR